MAKAQTSIRIRAVWSGPYLSDNRIIGYHKYMNKVQKPGSYAKEDPSLCILRMSEDISSLDATHNEF